MVSIRDSVERCFVSADRFGIPDFGVFFLKKCPPNYKEKLLEPPKIVWHFDQTPPKIADCRNIVHFVSKAENCSEERALELIKICVSDWKETLKNKSQFKLSDNDMLYTNGDDGIIKYKSLHEKPQGNYFGLRTVTLKKREKKIITPTQETSHTTDKNIQIEDLEDIEASIGDPISNKIDNSLVIYTVGWVVVIATIVIFVLFVLKFNDVIDIFNLN